MELLIESVGSYDYNVDQCKTNCPHTAYRFGNGLPIFHREIGKRRCFNPKNVACSIKETRGIFKHLEIENILSGNENV